jgi:acyl-homoserine-lactone acylase
MMRLARDTSDEDKLQALERAMEELYDIGHGRWQVPWGEINRFQRVSDAIVQQFSDAAPSIPVPFAPAAYGSLASIEQRTPSATKRIYGSYGNSFVAVVEFGKRVRAHAITAGGESGSPSSKHFSDEAQRYASGNLRDVYFYPEQLTGHTERRYRPGE